MATLASNFKEIIQSSNFSLTTITTAGCYYLPGFDRVERDTNKKTDLCDSKYQETTKKYILNSSKPIVIIGGRLQLYSTSKYFDNHEGGKDPEVLKNIKWRYKFVSKTQDSFKETIINEITELSKKLKKLYWSINTWGGLEYSKEN